MSKEKTAKAYKSSIKIYDVILTRKKWWSRLYLDLFWGGVGVDLITEKVLEMIPENFTGKLLDVPVGTAVFTYKSYLQMPEAKICCLDYSEEMLAIAKQRFSENEIHNVECKQGDVGNLDFPDESFDIVMTMNGIHVFPDKEKAYAEMFRVLKPKGLFIGCFYIKGESKKADWLVRNILSKKGWFSPPFETRNSIAKRLKKDYATSEVFIKGSSVYFKCQK